MEQGETSLFPLTLKRAFFTFSLSIVKTFLSTACSTFFFFFRHQRNRSAEYFHFFSFLFLSFVETSILRALPFPFPIKKKPRPPPSFFFLPMTVKKKALCDFSISLPLRIESGRALPLLPSFQILCRIKKLPREWSTLPSMKLDRRDSIFFSLIF